MCPKEVTYKIEPLYTRKSPTPDSHKFVHINEHRITYCTLSSDQAFILEICRRGVLIKKIP